MSQSNQDRYLVVSSDGHAGLHAADYRPYVDAKYRDAFDAALPIQIEATQRMSDYFLITEINEEWRRGRDARTLRRLGSERAGQGPRRGRHRRRGALSRRRHRDERAALRRGLQHEPGGRERRAHVGGLRRPQPIHARSSCRRRPSDASASPAFPSIGTSTSPSKKAQEARKSGLAGCLLPPMWGSFEAYHYSEIRSVLGRLPGPRDAGPLPFGSGADGAILRAHASAVATSDSARRRGRLPDGSASLADAPLTFMLWGGVFTRFPKLKVAITEGTSAWVPDYVDRLEFHYAETRESQKLGDFRGHLDKSPAETFRTNVKIGASCMSARSRTAP